MTDNTTDTFELGPERFRLAIPALDKDGYIQAAMQVAKSWNTKFGAKKMYGSTLLIPILLIVGGVVGLAYGADLTIGLYAVHAGDGTSALNLGATGVTILSVMMFIVGYVCHYMVTVWSQMAMYNVFSDDVPGYADAHTLVIGDHGFYMRSAVGTYGVAWSRVTARASTKHFALLIIDNALFSWIPLSELASVPELDRFIVERTGG